MGFQGLEKVKEGGSRVIFQQKGNNSSFSVLGFVMDLHFSNNSSFQAFSSNDVMFLTEVEGDFFGLIFVKGSLIILSNGQFNFSEISMNFNLFSVKFSYSSTPGGIVVIPEEIKISRFGGGLVNFNGGLVLSLFAGVFPFFLINPVPLGYIFVKWFVEEEGGVLLFSAGSDYV